MSVSMAILLLSRKIRNSPQKINHLAERIAEIPGVCSFEQCRSFKFSIEIIFSSVPLLE